jgi:hypothetical protein
MAPMSLKPSEASEGGEFPRGYLSVTTAKFGEYHYMTKDTQGNPTPALDENKKPIVTLAALITLENETGNQFEQVYSVGRPDRYTVSADGQVLEGGTLNKACNLYKLVVECVNQGYPDQSLSANLSETFVGMSAYWDEIPNGNRTLIVPVRDLTPPGANGAAPAAASPAAAPAAAAAPDMVAKAVELVQAGIATDGSISRQALGQLAFGQNLDNASQMQLMNVIFDESLVKALAAVGVKLEGETFSSN